MQTEVKGKARGPVPTRGSVHPAQQAAKALDMLGRATSGVRQLVLMLAGAVPTSMASPELVERLAEMEEDERIYQGRRGTWSEQETGGSAVPTAARPRGGSRKSPGASSRSKRKKATTQ